MKITKLLPTLGALSAITIAAPVFGSCAKNETVDEWIDASIDVDTTGFKKIKGQKYESSKALALYNKAIVDDHSILENDMKWGLNGYYKEIRYKDEPSFVSLSFEYKISNLNIDPTTSLISYDYSIKFMNEVNLNSTILIYYIDINFEFNKMPLTLRSLPMPDPYDYSITASPDLESCANWTNDTYTKIYGTFVSGNEDGDVIIPEDSYFFNDAKVTKANHDSITGLGVIWDIPKFYSYYLSDCTIFDSYK